MSPGVCWSADYGRLSHCGPWWSIFAARDRLLGVRELGWSALVRWARGQCGRFAPGSIGSRAPKCVALRHAIAGSGLAAFGACTAFRVLRRGRWMGCLKSYCQTAQTATRSPAFHVVSLGHDIGSSGLQSSVASSQTRYSPNHGWTYPTGRFAHGANHSNEVTIRPVAVGDGEREAGDVVGLVVC